MSDLVKKCPRCGFEHPSTRIAGCEKCLCSPHLFNRGSQKWVGVSSIIVPDSGEGSVLLIPNILDVINIGRAANNIVVIDNPQVLQHHAVIISDDNGCTIFNCDSQSVTLVNSLPVTTQLLKDGDEIKIGNTILRFLGPGQR